MKVTFHFPVTGKVKNERTYISTSPHAYELPYISQPFKTKTGIVSQMRPRQHLLHPTHPALQSGTLTSGVARFLWHRGWVNTMAVRNINYEIQRKDLLSCLLFGNILKYVERRFFFKFKISILPTLGLRRPVQPQYSPSRPPATSMILTTLKSIANKSLYRAYKRRINFFLLSSFFRCVCLSSSYEWKAKMSTGNATLEW